MIGTQSKNTLFLIIGGSFASLFIAASLLVFWMQPPNADLRLLVMFMAGSGLLSITFAYILHRFGVLRRLPSLRWALIGSIVLTVLLLIFNVWFTAQQMFFNVDHDLILMIILLIFGGMLAIIFGSFITNMLTESIQDLSTVSQELAMGKSGVRVKVKGNDELAQLARTFNKMLDTMQEVEAKKQQMDEARRMLIAGISHDLRTPLTSIRVMVEALQDGMVPDEVTQNRYLTHIIHEINYLNRWVNDLFDLAQLDLGSPPLEFEYTSLRDMISDTISTFRAQAERQQLTLESEIESSLDIVFIAPDKLQRVLNNLLENAITHTPINGLVHLRAVMESNTLHLSIHNTGSVISAEHLPNIFERFYRGDPARKSGLDGQRSVGLGLAIAKGFIQAHGGEIWVDSSPELGTTFHFTVPDAA